MMGCWIASLYGACFLTCYNTAKPSYFHVLHCSSQYHPLPNTTPRQALTLLTPCGGMRCALPPAPPSSFLFSCPSLLISTSSPAKYHTATSFNTSNALHPPPAFYFHVLHCSSQHHPLPNTTPRQALTLLTPCTPLQLSIFMSFTAHLNIIPCQTPHHDKL